MPWSVSMLNWSKTVSPPRQEDREQWEPGCFPANWQVTRMTGYLKPETLAALLLFKERYMDSFCVDFLLLHALPNVLGDHSPGLEMVLGLTGTWEMEKKGKKEGEKNNSPGSRHLFFFSWKRSFAEAHFHSHIRTDRCLNQLNGNTQKYPAEKHWLLQWVMGKKYHQAYFTHSLLA